MNNLSLNNLSLQKHLIAEEIDSLAEQYARICHLGQYREYNRLPAITHPEAVVQILKRCGFQDRSTLAIAWLHDILEDTSAQYEDLEKRFGRDIAQGVYLLTRNVGPEEYKQRLLCSPPEVQLIKLADTLHNITTLEQLKPHGIKRKQDDCRDFYLPLADRICPTLGGEIQFYLRQYENNGGDKNGTKTETKTQKASELTDSRRRFISRLCLLPGPCL
jgi:(p)ppGpp synthase/HD superfamily hydrolase